MSASTVRMHGILPAMAAWLARYGCVALLLSASAGVIAQSTSTGPIYKDAAESSATVTTTTTATTVTTAVDGTIRTTVTTTGAPLSPTAIVTLLRSGGYIVYFRHTATDFAQNDQNMRDFDDCANQRNLTADGRVQARRIGEAWKKLGIPVGRVMASPFCRTREVAQLMFGRYERALDVRGGPGTAGDGVRYQPLARLLETPPAPGTNDVISSHGNPYQALHPDTPYLREGEAAIIRPLPRGSDGHEVVGRITWDQWPAR